MAWTAPRTWVVGEIVTASLMNTDIRDNLNYLKGVSGTISLDSGISVAGAGYFGVTAGATPAIVADRVSGTASIRAGTGATKNTLVVDGNGGGCYLNFYAADDVLLAFGGGKVGIGAVTAPQGKLHGYGTIGGFIFYEFDGVDGTARTVIPNAAGDVVYGVMPIWAVRASDGTTRSGAWSTGGTVLLAPGATTDIYSIGANILQLQVAANGAVTVQRTGGALTYKVVLWLVWL